MRGQAAVCSVCKAVRSTQTVGETGDFNAVHHLSQFPCECECSHSYIFLNWPDLPDIIRPISGPIPSYHLFTRAGMLPPPHWFRVHCIPHLDSDWLAIRTLGAPIGPISRTLAAGLWSWGGNYQVGYLGCVNQKY